MPILSIYAALLAAILCEVAGTSLLPITQQFTRPLPTIFMALFYLAAFYFLSITLKSMPVGIAYALWSGLGIVLISIIGFAFFKQSLDTPALIGLALIVSGVVVINLFSKSVSH